MDSDVQLTSFLTYEVAKRSTARQLVEGAITQLGQCTDREIAQLLDLDINSITGRRNELVGMGHVEKAGYRQCSVTGRLCCIWAIAAKDVDKILVRKYAQVKRLTHADMLAIAECLDKSIDARAAEFANRCRLLGGL